MVDAMKLGGGGCISASCNTNTAAIRAMYEKAHAGDWLAAEAALAPINAHRKAIQDGGIIPALKAYKALQSKDDRWLNLRPPLLNAQPSLGHALEQTLS